MQLKTVSSIGLAFLLVFGVVGAASAQDVAATPGILIRVDKPAANTWAAIGDSIEITILCYTNTLSSGFTLGIADSSVADASATSDGAGVHITYSVTESDDTDGDEQVDFGDGAGKSGIDTFKVKLKLPASRDIQTTNNRSVKVVIDPAGEGANQGPLNNLMTNKKIAPANSGFGASRVGDGKLFGIDTNRPDVDGVFTRLLLDTKGTVVDTTEEEPGKINKVSIKNDVTIKIDLVHSVTTLLATKATKIEIAVVETDSGFNTAPIKFELTGDALTNANNSVSRKLKAGDFADNERIRILANLMDPAGNRGATEASSENASDVTFPSGNTTGEESSTNRRFADSVELIADGNPPKITMKYPIPDSMQDRISAALTQTLDNYKRLPGEATGVQMNRKLKPLDFRVSEALDSIRIVHGDSSKGFSTIPAGEDPDANPAKDATGGDSTATLALPWKYAKAGGVQKDLTIEVWDSLGNKTSKKLTGIWYDEKAPVIGDLFPKAADAPKDAANQNKPTITLASKDPVFTIDEKLDSLSVRYREAGGGKALVQGYGKGNVRLETTGKLMSWPVNDTSFIEAGNYELQILAIDLAGNAVAEDGGTLTFKKSFMNPDADKFKIVDKPDQKDKVVAGVDFTMNISVIDTTLTRIEESDVRAVTYRQAVALGVIVSADQAGALAGVTFGGPGVSAAPAFALPADLAAAGKVAKGAILNADAWTAGQRNVTFKSEKPLKDVMVMVAEGSIDPGTGAYSIRTSASLSPVNVEVAELSKFVVTASEGAVSGGNVGGSFTINVTPTDAFGNPSMKIDNTVGSKTYTDVAVRFSTSNAAVTVPSGDQTVKAGGTDFGAVAADLDGSAIVAVTSVGSNYLTGATQGEQKESAASSGDKAGALSGSVTVNFVREGGPGADPGAPAAVANVVVQDYKGADGQGDQGGMVVVSFPNSSDHDAVSHYQIHREIDSTTGMDDEGNAVELETPVKKWVAWTSVSFAADSGDQMGDAEGDMQTVIVPAIDNVATNWGVTSVSGAGSSDNTTASKRVFTKESIQQTLALLGMPEAELLTDEELSNQFNAPEDYVKSLIGDRKNVIFAPVNPDVSALLGSAAVPANIRTDGHPAAGKFLSSLRTSTEEPVAAVDDIAPAAVTGGSGTGAGGVIVSWTASVNDAVVGSIPYRGYNIPILGVKGYKVMRGASADALEQVATLAPGSTQFTDGDLPDGATSLVYRIDAYDDNNVAMSDLITVTGISVRRTFVDANGDPVYLVVLGGSLDNDFEDFNAFAAAFGSQKGDANYNPQADVNDDGTVDFSDFTTWVGTFGRTAVVPAGSKLAVVPQRPGVNADTEMTLELASEKVLVGETISLTVSMANARALNGFGLELVYDADKFEFVSAVPSENDLLKSEGGETPLFQNWPKEGRVSVANAIIESGSVSGEGALVTFTFKVLSEFEDNARFEIARGVVFDADQLQNPVITLGALDVQSTPTEFALHQNFPNPFNPQTNIPYDLAEGGDVVLRIYNLLGQEVRTLVRERQAPGRYTVQWTGMDDRGVSVSSGIYFYQVSVAGKFQDAKRLMLLK